MKRAFSVSVLLLAACMLTGCTTVKQSFPGKDPESVWTALVAVANAPDYSGPSPEDRWTIEQNNVAVYEQDRRIEIHRVLRRTLYRPGSRPLRQGQEWRLRVVFFGGDPPKAELISRGWNVPLKAQAEGERYFADVQTVLSGSFPADGFLEPEAPSPPPVVLPPPPDQPAETAEPLIDIEQLEPGDG